MTTKSRILIADDEPNARNALAEILKDEGYAVETAADGFKALAHVDAFAPDLLLTDLKMPGMDGLELMRKVHDREAHLPVVVMTAFGDVETAVGAMRMGARDYLTKPLNSDELIVVVERELESRQLRKRAGQLEGQLSERYRFDNIVGSSPEMQGVFKTVAQVASSRATVLITGESGTGKELVAAAIHHRSPRASGPFVKLHCAALHENLLESELFGHEKGSFTGADRRREGRFELADHGTLFLDEIGEIPLSTQVKLLRVLQEHEFERVGGSQTLRVDVRVVAATNRDLKQLVAEGRFREDLFYRLNVINVRIPALRERPSDIPPLARHFLEKYAAENQKTVARISDAALGRLTAHAWPGNVRELENVIERAVVLAEGDVLDVQHMPPEIAPPAGVSKVPTIPGCTLDDIERYAILETLEACGGSTTKAAEMLGISVRKVQYRMHDYVSAPKSGVPAIDDGHSEPPEEVTH